MNRYTILVSVEHASGWQTWTVDADNEEEAIAKFNSGEGEPSEQEVEVTAIGQPHIIDKHDIEPEPRKDSQ